MKRLFTRIVAAALIACSLSFAPAARAASMTDYLENLVIDYIFRGQAFAAPTVLAIGLLTAACSDSSAGTEVSNANNYARVLLNPSTTNWANTQASGTGASSGTSGQTSNSSAINFNTASGSWGSVGWFAIYPSATYGGGSMLFCAAITGGAQTVASGSTPSFAAGALTVQIDN